MTDPYQDESILSSNGEHLGLEVTFSTVNVTSTETSPSKRASRPPASKAMSGTSRVDEVGARPFS
jgi:hypothetical protein